MLLVIEDGMTGYGTLAAVLVSFGCADKAENTADTSGDADTDGAIYGELMDFDIDYAWGERDYGRSDTLTLTIEDGFASSYTFGMAETAAGDDGWYGEDCLEGDGETQICHVTGANGLILSTVATPDEVVASETTLFSEDLAFDTAGADRLTYYLSDGTDCWTWGHDTSYYPDCAT